MSGTINSAGKIEVKIRPFSGINNQERPDQKGVSRVYLCKEALTELKLDPGQVCYLSKLDEPGHQKREAIVWLTFEKNLSKKVIQVSKTFQEACGLKLGDDIVVQAAGTLRESEIIKLKDVTTLCNNDTPELGKEDKSHWEWYIRENLGRAEVIFPGMTFKNVSLRGPKRTLTVESINGCNSGIARYNDNCSIQIIGSRPDHSDSLLISKRLQIVGVSGIDQALSKLNRFLGGFDKQLKVRWAQRSCAVLLHGGHGTGKTFLINKIINCGWTQNIFKIDFDLRPSAIRTIFADAKNSQPSIIVVDELESIVSKEDTNSQVITKIIGEELDNLSRVSSQYIPRVLVLTATLNASNIPLALKKRGRIRTEILLPVPDVIARKSILKSLKPPLPPDIYEETLEKLGDRTHAYTAEDLVSLLDTACEIADERIDGCEQDLKAEDFYISQSDIENALQTVRPTAMHDISLKPPSVRWDQIGGQDNVKKVLRRAIETPLLYPERMKRIGASAKKGLLLYGPPGCSKTLSAQAMATEIDFNFFAVKGAELLNMYVGESERAIRDIFARARAASPSIIFFDEIESIGSQRDKNGRGNSIHVLTTLLNEMDGIETLKDVTVLAATNQPQVLDLALLRPGRFDKLLYVAPPDLAGREEILALKKRKMDFADDVDIREIAKLTDGYSGAELVGICETACDEVMEKCETTGNELQIHMKDIVAAIDLVKKQITPEMIAGYERWAAGVKTMR
ncbi:ATPase family gene 2 protein [Erysiphe neolycopersici]|uniref:ATPase family gene 2 protein n=1 Tax=Erysiphe neolycopersici TaxID=212602 RepID=A0A420HDX0_9PEZI|nr:ATPase family gene 2 protein [Erysiphe neolycopersici]